jgi:hypothetical protein
LEGNNAITENAPRLTLGTTIRPTIYPAGDVDVFTVNVPRAGRLDVRVTGVVDNRAYPWNKSGLPIDPIVELYTASGALIKRVDNEWEAGTELAQLNVSGWTRVIVRVVNWYPNGSRTAYTVTPTYVDNVIPVATIATPVAGATDVSRFVDPVIRFSEAVSGVSAASVRLWDVGSSTLVPGTVVYDSAKREARIVPADKLGPARTYRIEATSAVKDAGGNALVSTSGTFVTGTASFTDTAGTTFEPAIEWLVATGITFGCSAEQFCPTHVVKREQMAGFLARALDLPVSDIDYFTDDSASSLEDKINRLADAGLTTGCGRNVFCPTSVVTRAQMASFLARALNPPLTTTDFFADDNGSTHENAINRLAATGIVSGCATASFCPSAGVTREQMAAFLYRAFGGG